MVKLLFQVRLQQATNDVVVRGDDVFGTSLLTRAFGSIRGDDMFGTSLLK